MALRLAVVAAPDVLVESSDMAGESGKVDETRPEAPALEVCSANVEGVIRRLMGGGLAVIPLPPAP